MIILAHSHRDQAVSYGVSAWLYRAWPDLFVYVTHRHFPELEALMERHYLQLIPQASALLCLVSKASLGSDAVSLELQVARKAGKPTILLLHPLMRDEEVCALQTVIDIWDEGYGGVIDPRLPAGERRLTDRLCGSLDRDWPESVPAGTLLQLVAEPRTLADEKPLAIPDVDAVFAGHASREQAEQYLALLMRAWDSRMRARGLESAVDAIERLFPPESQAVQLLTSYPDELRPVIMRQLRPLINDGFRDAAKLLGHVHRDNAEVSYALLRILLYANDFD